MKKIICCIVLFYWTPTLYAAGGITHMYLASQAAARQKNKSIKQLLTLYADDYLVGSYYPDSGYVKGTHYGENSHWDLFIYAMLNYLKEKYQDPIVENPGLVAFLLGCASHRVSDELFHFHLYHAIAKYDFKGNENKAHQYGDFGIDALIKTEKNQPYQYPLRWKIPVSDLIQVYRRMGYPEYKASEIKWGTSVLYIASFFERMFASSVYPYFYLKMPWTRTHYENFADGGVKQNINEILNYQTKLWELLRQHNQPALKFEQVKPSIHVASSTVTFSEMLLNNHIVDVSKQENGKNLEIHAVIIQKYVHFSLAMKDFFTQLNHR